MNTPIYKPRLYFEKNMGQLPSEVKYKIKANDYITFFTEDKLIVSLPSNIKNTRNVFYMKLENKNNGVYIEGQDKQIGTVNYLIGADESKWINNIPTYLRIKYQQVYENIDLYYYTNDRNLEYDFVLSKGANPKDICIGFEGVDNIEINDNNDVVLTVGDVCAILLKPEVYQIIDNIKTYVDCEYTLDENKCISFLINEYEKEYELVLDPVLKVDYATYIGGANCDYGTGIAVDSEGCVYITGYTEGGYPTTAAYNPFYRGGNMDAFVTKLDRDGETLSYSTYIGGSNDDYSNSIVVDDGGCAYITGSTRSSNFPTSSDAYQTTYGGSNDAFVTKLNQNGQLLMYSTYVGGSGYNVGNGIALDSEGYAYITGQTGSNFPTTPGAYQTTSKGNLDVFVSKLDINGKDLVYSTYIGGSDYDCAYGIAVDSEGYAYVTGYTGGGYPVTKGAYQATYGGGIKDAFISKVSADGSALIYSTYIGGTSAEQGNSIAVDNQGYAYIVGYTQGSFPTLHGYKDNYSGSRDIFVSKISIDGRELIYSTYIGETGTEDAYSIAVDSEGYAYVTGYALGDIFVSKISTDGSNLINYTTMHDGSNDYGKSIVIDSKGYIYIAGYGESGYPTTQGAYQTICGGNRDVIVSKMLLIDFDVSFNCTPSEIKLYDVITTKLNFRNLSKIPLDVKIKYQPLDSSVLFVANSLFIQGITHSSDTIPKEIYLPDIQPKNNVEIELDLKSIIEKFPEQIPITVIVEVYDNRSDIPVFVDSKSNTLYIDTVIGTNYIPGCNSELYNLSINGELQITASGIPIIYYKSGNSYIYIEPSEEQYIYKVISNIVNVVEYKII